MANYVDRPILARTKDGGTINIYPKGKGPSSTRPAPSVKPVVEPEANGSMVESGDD